MAAFKRLNFSNSLTPALFPCHNLFVLRDLQECSLRARLPRFGIGQCPYRPPIRIANSHCCSHQRRGRPCGHAARAQPSDKAEHAVMFLLCGRPESGAASAPLCCDSQEGGHRARARASKNAPKFLIISTVGFFSAKVFAWFLQILHWFLQCSQSCPDQHVVHPVFLGETWTCSFLGCRLLMSL